MVYIRDVAPGSRERLMNTAREIESLGVEMLLITDTLQAARHAVSKGWILEADIAPIAEEMVEDEA